MSKKDDSGEILNIIHREIYGRQTIREANKAEMESKMEEAKKASSSGTPGTPVSSGPKFPPKKKTPESSLAGIGSALNILKSGCTGSTRKPNPLRPTVLIMSGGAIDPEAVKKLIPKEDKTVSNFLREQFNALLDELKKRGKTVDDAFKIQIEGLLDNLEINENKIRTFENILAQYLHKFEEDSGVKEQINNEEMLNIINKYDKKQQKTDKQREDSIKMIESLVDAVSKSS
jgi:hypothetical protein